MEHLLINEVECFKEEACDGVPFTGEVGLVCSLTNEVACLLANEIGLLCLLTY